MKKLVLIGRSEAGKTTLTQALRGEKIHYHKTQYVNNFDVIVDTPGEYAQTKGLGHALALYTYESDVVGLLVSAIEPYCLFPPCITCMANIFLLASFLILALAASFSFSAFLTL